jgi:ArsR family metal-binding transcriptional regulator
MFLSDYTVRLVLSDCCPSSQEVNALVDLYEDISEVFPYLNTVLKGLQYDHDEKTLTVKIEGRLITFRPRQIAVTKLADQNESKSVIEELKKIVNDTYTNRDHIKPIYHTRSMPRPLDIYKLLPGNNCKECGELTCLAFALNLVNDKARLIQCPLLFKKEFEVNRSKLEAFLPDLKT